MIQWRYGQKSFCDGFWAREVGDLWPQWMRVADRLLKDEELIEAIYQAQGKRYQQSRKRGRKQTPAEVVLRMLVLKHANNWSFAVTEQEVRANVVCREFARIGLEKVPDAKVLAKIAKLIGPQVVEQIHRRIVELAKQKKVAQGRRMRLDTTVVETNIHYPTDSSLLGDGTRVLTRLMKKVEQRVGGLAQKVRNRMRSVRKQVIAIAISSRRKGAEGEKQRQRHYRKLLRLTRQVVNQANRVSQQVGQMSRYKQVRVAPLLEEMATMVERSKQVIRQTKARVLEGNTQFADKLVSVFEAHTEVIRKGKASKPNEFGKMVKIQEAENQLIVDYEVFAERPVDSDLLVDSVKTHQQALGRMPQLVAADAAFYSARNEQILEQEGVQRIAIPSRATKSRARREKQKKRWFKNGQRWRTGSEGRISVLKRRHGLNRSRYRGQDGIEKWVGLGVIADNLRTLGGILPWEGATT
ncbi:MAG TPA: ISNCY family transposase [Anaerolineales bacterium]